MLKKNIRMKDFDIEIWKAMQLETIRQENYINLIASENYASKLVMQAQGSHLTNKYAEGYPKNRYYTGCEYIDIIEQIAINRAKILFKSDYANVQPHSGSQANYAVYTSLLNTGDTILGMDITHGGHLTHGSSVNFSGKLYNCIFYGVNKKGYINYDQVNSLAIQYKPKMIIGGFSAYSGIVDWSLMRSIADNVNAYLFVDMSHVSGLVASGLYPNPLPYAHVVTTTTHKTLAGPRGGLILAKGGNEELYKKLDSNVFPGTQGGPMMHIIAAKAIAMKEAMKPEFKKYQNQVIKNAKVMAKCFISLGFQIVSGTTNNHLFLINLTNKNLTGKEASKVLNLSNINVNKNSIPNDIYKPSITSGLRIGTPAVTRRGLKENDICEITKWICEILNNIHNNDIIFYYKTKVLKMCKRYPLYF